jgi:hypothetical protein
VEAPASRHDKVFVWLRDANTDKAGSPPYPHAATAHLGDTDVAAFQGVPYGQYNVYVMFDGEDLRKSAWTPGDVKVDSEESHPEITLHLQKPIQQ